MADGNDYNQRIIDEFRANSGKVGGEWDGYHLLLLHSTGAKTGQHRVNPVGYRPDGDRFVVLGSNGGAPTHPDWYHNLRANPQVTVEVGNERLDARARVAANDERDRLWREFKKEIPVLADYEQNTSRQIPVVVLERVA
jgi:deazaflavin-dependent oxidoreductase (nitroreductase family)